MRKPILVTLCFALVILGTDRAWAQKLILLGEDFELTALIGEEKDTVEFPSIEVKRFAVYSFLSTEGVCENVFSPSGRFTIESRFLVEPGTYSSPGAKAGGGGVGGLHEIKGPHLAVRIQATSTDSECTFVGAPGCTCTLDELYIYLQR